VEIPLFPLNTVLFPGAPLRLHIFEDRYKQMMNLCIEEKLPFGVVLIASGDDALGPLPQPHVVGCTAQITQVQRLPEDRMNMMAIGRERFRVRHLYTDRPYLHAEVDTLPLTDENPEWTQGGSARVRELFKRYMHAMQVAGQQPPLADTLLPTTPLQMLYFASFWLQTELESKQQLLECASTNELVPRLVRQFHREIKLIDILLARVDIANGETPFSLN
jgi:Lon protease-like protein